MVGKAPLTPWPLWVVVSEVVPATTVWAVSLVTQPGPGPHLEPGSSHCASAPSYPVIRLPTFPSHHFFTQ